MDIKKLIRHELLNIFTILNVYLDDGEDMSALQKKEMLEYVEMAGLMVAHEDIFLGEKPKFFSKRSSLAEMIDMVLDIESEMIRKKGVSISCHHLARSVDVDRHYFESALTAFLRYILPYVSVLTFSFSQKDNALTVRHDASDQYLRLVDSLLMCIQDKSMKSASFAYQIFMHILQLHGMKIEFADHEVRFVFPEESGE